MNTNRLSKKLSVALNVQMTNEANASQIYLSYAEWADGYTSWNRKYRSADKKNGATSTRS